MAQLQMSRGRGITAAAVAAAIVTGLGGCGGEVLAVRVGRTAISRDAVAHWMSVMAPEHVVPVPPGYTACVAREQAQGSPYPPAELVQECRREYRALKQQALDFLISSAWVIGTLAKDGLRVSDREVEKRLEEHATPLAAEGGDADDQKLAARTELAETMIRRSLARADHTVTNAQVAAYYRTHRSRFLVREKRYIDIENLKTRAQALQIRHEVELGESAPFTRGVLHEVIERLPSVKYDRGEDGIRSAILQARLNTITGPLPNGEYGLFEVKRIVAAHYEPLAQVRGTIEQQLAGEQRRLALSRFLAAWRKHWRAVTDCHPGYVVQRCRQYKGPLAPEEPPAFK